MNNKTAKIYVVDDDASVRKSLARLLRSVDYQVDTFSSPQNFLDLKQYEHPCCLILDVSMPGLSGLEVQQKLVSNNANVPIVFITGYGSIPMSVRALKQGAMNFLEKPVDRSELLAEVEKAIQLNTRVDNERAEILAIEQHINSLTPREREVFDLVVKGYLNKQIAAQLEVCEKTIKVHRARVMEKMKVKSLAELVHLNEQISPDQRISQLQPYRV